MIIKNFTPHEIKIFKKEDCSFNESIRKWIINDIKIEPIIIIPPCGKLLNIKFNDDNIQLINIIDNIPIYKKEILYCDEIPDNIDICIVSAMYYIYAIQNNLKNCNKLYIVCDPVYDNVLNPKPIGCLGLTQ